MPDPLLHLSEDDRRGHPVPSAVSRRPGPGTGRRVSLFAAAVAVLLLIGFATVEFAKVRTSDRLADATRSQQAEAPLVDVVTVKNSPANGNLTLPGETAAWYESTLYARVSGYVATWTADIGDRVHEGQVLATIDTPELDAELAASRAKLKVAEADVRVRDAEAEFAQTTYERWKNSPKGVVSEQEREDRKAGFVSAQAKLAAAQAQVNLVQADVDRLTAFEQFKKVTAPFDGTVAERRIDIGNLVTAGSTAGTSLLYRIVKSDPIRVFVDVPQDAAVDVAKPGTDAVISANDLEGRKFDGRVTRAAGAVDPKSRTMRVEVDLPNKDGSLVPGLYVQTAFQLAGSGVAEVPAAALVFRADGPQVAVVGNDGAVTFSPVKIGRDYGDRVELASGVKPGERVVLNISSEIAQGEKVRVHEEDAPLTSAAGPNPPAP